MLGSMIKSKMGIREGYEKKRGRRGGGNLESSLHNLTAFVIERKT